MLLHHLHHLQIFLSLSTILKSHLPHSLTLSHIRGQNIREGCTAHGRKRGCNGGDVAGEEKVSKPREAGEHCWRFDLRQRTHSRYIAEALALGERGGEKGGERSRGEVRAKKKNERNELQKGKGKKNCFASSASVFFFFIPLFQFFFPSPPFPPIFNFIFPSFAPASLFSIIFYLCFST